MPVPPIRPTAIGVYVYRRVGGGVELLQIRRSATAASHHHSWQTVYGGVEKGETAVQAALRELKEETGLTPIRLWQVEYLESFYFMPHDYVLVMPVFAAEVARDATPILNEEHDAARWVNEGQIEVSFMWRTQREALTHLLDELHHPSTAAPFLKAPLT